MSLKHVIIPLDKGYLGIIILKDGHRFETKKCRTKKEVQAEFKDMHSIFTRSSLSHEQR